MAAPALQTYRDLVDHLGDVYGFLASDRELRLARGAIREAVDNVSMTREWTYYVQHGRIDLVASYSTGTVTYDLTGGTYEYELTLASGTWPTWSRYGRLEITGYDPIFKIAERKTSAIVTLDPSFEPGADITSATAYELFRSVYTLPSDLYKLHSIIDENHWWRDSYITATEWMGLERRLSSDNRPFRWTIMGAPDLYGSLAIALYGRPPSAESLDFIYSRKAPDLRISGYATGDYGSSSGGGTVSASSGGTTVTGTSTAFANSHVGTVIRLRTSGTNVPDGLDGEYLYDEQRIVTAVGSTTSITVDSALSNDYSNGAYCLSDPVDVAPYMLEVVKRGCELQFAIRIKPGEVKTRQGLYDMAMLDAWSRDNVSSTHETQKDDYLWNSPQWPNCTLDSVSTTAT